MEIQATDVVTELKDMLAEANLQNAMLRVQLRATLAQLPVEEPRPEAGIAE